MKKSEFSFLSANGKTIIRGFLWEPECAPKALIQIAHGITEHMGRYEAMAAYFTERGYAIAGHDQLGHGRSLDVQEPLPMYFGPTGSWRFVVRDLESCVQLLKTKFPGAPHCLLGFSLGSFAVRCLLGERPDAANAAIWAGTGQTSGAERWFAGTIAKREEKRFGDKKGTPMLQKLTMDTYNQKFKPCRTGSDWLCANPAAVDEYIADPLCGEGFTVGAFRELLTGMAISASDAHVAKMNPALPILLVSGAEDPVGSFGKGVNAVEAQLKRHGFVDVEKQLFAGMRHDLFRESVCLDVYECMLNWLEKHI